MKGNLPLEVAETTLGDAGSFLLAWTFMEHSYFYVLFVGILNLLELGFRYGIKQIY